jgi:hypothetical protein
VYFVTRDGRGVVNYPKLHRKNGETKQSRTGDNYKSLVRTVKNARRKLYEDGVISKDLSPSYFVECLLYNIPNSEYGSDLAQTYLNVLNWLNDNRSTFASMKCQNGVTDLFGSTPEQWKVDKAEQLVNVLIRQWNNWPN